MLRKPKSVLKSLICKLPNLLRPSRQILCQTMGCLLGALLWKSPYEQFLNNFYPPAANPVPPKPKDHCLKMADGIGKDGKRVRAGGVGRLTAEPQQCGNVPSKARSFGDDHDTAFPTLLLLLPRRWMGTNLTSR